MAQIKICPDCSTEYFAHIETCADCGAVLLHPEELKKIQEERKRCMASAFEDPAAVREGSLKWMDELYNVLINSGVPCIVSTDEGCSKGCCGSTYRLLVSRADAERADALIEEYCADIYPEIRASRDMMDQGKCPACGYTVGPDMHECPDCGLTLIITE